MKQYLWTSDGGRLQYQSASQSNAINWLFLPGGPGLGSEALAGLTQLLKNKIPGVIWHFDLPNDGSNILSDKPISNWRSALIQAITAFDKVILVAHSTPGMYVQTMPELETLLHGLVLIGSAPDASWQKQFGEYCKNNMTSAIEEAEVEYMENPTNKSLRELLIASAQNCFVTEKSLEEGKSLIKRIPVNYAASEQAEKSFDSDNYQATWVPKKVPTLIMAGSNDYITPLDLFQKNKDYQNENIMLKEIAGAGHYPWFENPDDIVKAFEDYVKERINL